MFKILKIHKVHHKIFIILAVLAIAVGIIYAVHNTKGAVSCETTSVVLSKAVGSYKTPSGDTFSLNDKILSSSNPSGSFSSDNVKFSATFSGDQITKDNVKTIYYVDSKDSSKNETLVNVAFNSAIPELSFDIVLKSYTQVSLDPKNNSVYTLDNGSNLNFDGGKLYSTTASIDVDGKAVAGISLDDLKMMIEKKTMFGLTNNITKENIKIRLDSFDPKTVVLTFSIPTVCEITEEEEPACEDTTENVVLDPKSSPLYTLDDGSDLNFDGSKLYSKAAIFSVSGKSSEYISLDDLKMMIEKRTAFSIINTNSKGSTPLSVTSFDSKTNALTLSISILCESGEEEKPERCTDDSLAKEEVELSVDNPSYLLGNNIEINFNGKLLYAKNVNFVSDVMSGPKLEMDIDILQSVLDKNTVIKVVNLDTKEYTSMNVVSLDPASGTVSFLICGTEKFNGKTTGSKTGTIGSVGFSGSAGAVGQVVSTTPIQSNTNNSVVNTPAVSSGAGAAIPVKIEKPNANCDVYLTDYIKFGKKNSVENVNKLQKFLKEYEGFTNLVVDGFYGKTSFDAVEAFQKKYLPDVLSPWGISDSTGYVFKTTVKKINELYCIYTNKTN